MNKQWDHIANQNAAEVDKNIHNNVAHALNSAIKVNQEDLGSELIEGDGAGAGAGGGGKTKLGDLDLKKADDERVQ